MELTDDMTLVVWPVAAIEAKMTGWPEIEPHHMLCAALKFVEMETGELAQVLQDESAAEQVAGAQQRVRQMLEQQCGLSIPEGTQRLRRALRLAGPGGPAGQVLHRSQATRALFDRASGLAADRGRSHLDAADLVMAILDSPAGPVASAMRRLEIAPAAAPPNQFEQEYPDIFQPIEPGPSNAQAEGLESLAAVIKVIQQWLSQPVTPSQPCLLVAAGERSCGEVVRLLAGLPEMKTIFIEVNSQALLQSAQDRPPDRLLAELAERLDGCVQSGNIYFFDNFHRYLMPELAGERLPAGLPRWMARLDGRFLFGLAETHYRRLIAGRGDWKGLFREVWIHERPDTMML